MWRTLVRVLVIIFVGPCAVHATAPAAPAAAGVAPPATSSPDRSPGTGELDEQILHAMRERGLPGLAVSILVDGRVVHARGYGLSNLELQTPVTPQSSFKLASVTKTFTAMLVMRLVQDGAIGLDDPIDRHLAGLPAHWHGITVAQLLSHTSGIPSFTDDVERRCNPDQAPSTYRRGDAVREVACHPLLFAPGSGWSYGDTGYYLLAMLIERVTGAPYEAALSRWITGPLGMRRTHVLDYHAIVPGRVDGYTPVPGGFRNAPRFEFEEVGGGGLVSTLEDMNRLVRAFETDVVLSRASRERMRQPAVLADGSTALYGFGLGLTPYRGHARFGHSGGGGLGFATAFTHFPEHRVTVIVLSNADQPPGAINDVANRLAIRFFGADGPAEVR